ncbi:MAG: acyl-CoA dehydrogenase family protein, partial [Planctomycetota bacterium]
MDFRLSDEQQAVQDLAREFAQNVCAPTAAERDKNEAFPDAEWKKAAEIGLAGIIVPEEYGGGGMGNLALSLALIEVNKADASVGVTLSVHNSLCNSCITHWASEETKHKYLPKLASGEWLGGYA